MDQNSISTRGSAGKTYKGPRRTVVLNQQPATRNQQHADRNLFSTLSQQPATSNPQQEVVVSTSCQPKNSASQPQTSSSSNHQTAVSIQQPEKCNTQPQSSSATATQATRGHRRARRQRDDAQKTTAQQRQGHQRTRADKRDDAQKTTAQQRAETTLKKQQHNRDRATNVPVRSAARQLHRPTPSRGSRPSPAPPPAPPPTPPPEQRRCTADGDTAATRPPWWRSGDRKQETSIQSHSTTNFDANQLENSG